jgi:putative glutamine amidotransferase
MKPIIGIVSKKNIYSGKLNATLYFDYIQSIYLAGGVPLLLPLINDPVIIESYIKQIDGLLIPGGIDPNPKTYHQLIKPLCGRIDDELDAFELRLIEEARKQKVPIFGICRGIQILNVAYNGTLYQDISYDPHYNKNIIHAQDEYEISGEQPVHEINIMKDSILYDLYGKSLHTNSFHHQTIDQLGKGLKVTAKTKDGVIEAIESTIDPCVLAVQWHPEKMSETSDDQLNLFKWFINECMIKNGLKKN